MSFFLPYKSISYLYGVNILKKLVFKCLTFIVFITFKTNILDQVFILQETFFTPQGKLKNKKLQQLISSLTEADLGPYAGGSYTGANKETVKLEPCPLSKLVEGKNLEKVVVGKVVCSVSLDEPIPL